MSHSYQFKDFKLEDNLDISLYGYHITDIYLRVPTLDQDDVYKMIQDLSCQFSGEIIFRTNGMIMQSMTYVFPEKYKLYGDIYPVSIDRIIKCIDGLILNVKLDENIKPDNLSINVLIKYKSCESYKNIYNSDKEIETSLTTYYQAENILVPSGWQQYKHKVKIGGVVRYLLFYLEPGLKIDNIVVNLCNVSQNYSYTQMNTLSPYLYLGQSLPKNYLFIPYFQKDTEEGYLNLSRFDDIEIYFNFKKNHGGRIYLIAETLNRMIHHLGLPYYLYSNCEYYENFQWDFTKNYNQLQKEFCFEKCIICQKLINKDQKFYECENCNSVFHKICYKQECPNCLTKTIQLKEFIADHLTVTI